MDRLLPRTLVFSALITASLGAGCPSERVNPLDPDQSDVSDGGCPEPCGAGCGDGTCDPGESCASCPDDCGLCLTAVQGLARGPYIQRVSWAAATIRWRTERPTTSTVMVGEKPNELGRVVSSDRVTTEHELEIQGLAPDTRYYYGFGESTSAFRGGAEYWFKTAPQSGSTAPVRAWVIGDAGTANDNQRRVRDGYMKFAASRPADLWVMLGDNAYGSGTDDEYQRAVFDMYEPLLRTTSLFSTLGNHDGASADSATQSGVYYDLLTLPAQGELGGIPSATEAYYAFNWGPIHWVCLDSFESDTAIDGPMMKWLDTDLQAATEPWIIAFWHHPPYSKGSHNSDTEQRMIDMRERALPILESYGVDLVLTGHSHSYERSVLMSGHYGASNTIEPSHYVERASGDPDGTGPYEKVGRRGAVYVVAGSSGKASGGLLNHPAMWLSLNELGSLVLDVTDKSLDGRFLNADGQVDDHFEIVK